jgi:uncharacterized protein (TIGR02271 family)
MSPVSEHPTVISVEGAFGRVESDGPEEHDGDLKVLVNFENGERLWVPADKLILQEDGNFQLLLSLSELSFQHTRPTIAARPADLERMAAVAPAPAMDVTQQMVPPPGLQVEAAPAPPSAAEVYTRPAAATAEPEEVLDEPYFPQAPTDPTPEPDFDRVQVSRVVESYREDVGAALLRETVDIHRVPVNQYVDEAPPIRYEDDRIIIPVLEEVLSVEKRLMVKEEVVVTKRRTQVTSDERTMRQDTSVVAAPAATRAADTTADEQERFRRHHAEQGHPGGHGFAYYEPAYRFGQLLRTAPRYQGWHWEQIEPEARALWERDNPGTWDKVRPAVLYAWSPPRSTA